MLETLAKRELKTSLIEKGETWPGLPVGYQDLCQITNQPATVAANMAELIQPKYFPSKCRQSR